MPTVAIKEITEEQDLDINTYQEVGFDLNDHAADVLDAVEFEHSGDAVEWIRHKDNVDIEGIVDYIEEIIGKEVNPTFSIKDVPIEQLFAEIMKRVEDSQR